MFSYLSIAVICFSIILVVIVLVQIVKGRLLLKYSLLWFVLALVAFFSALFPDPVFLLAHLIGFDTASNFILFVAIFLVLTIALSLSVIVSKQQAKLNNTIQELALLKHDTEESSIQQNRH